MSGGRGLAGQPGGTNLQTKLFYSGFRYINLFQSASLPVKEIVVAGVQVPRRTATVRLTAPDQLVIETAVGDLAGCLR